MDFIFLKGAFCFFLLCAAAFVSGCGDAGRLDSAELEVKKVGQALALVQAGQPDKAAELLGRVLESDPGLARVHLELAIILHEVDKDYVGALYHYRRYLLLRPESEKTNMIEERMRLARQMLAAGVVGTDKVSAARIEELEKENARIKSRINKLESDLEKAREISRVAIGSVQATNSVDNPDAGRPGTTEEDGGINLYTVKRGDSLSSIAARVYKDATRWDQIYEANRKELESSNDLKIGQVLIIP